ncbi:MAG: type II toxin-antitoxin system HipA family toxin [Alphaproteobacteria bacterium]|nr:type II toxin-antitoxin system HipA family toxin [Alphaproteobacteria bacterium]
MKLNVFLNMYGKRQQVGILAEEGKRIFFQYAPDFLKEKVELSPFKLPLASDVFEDKKQTFDGLFGLFNDSLPDGWGCLLLDRKLMKQGLSYQTISPLHRLSLIGKNPMGALEYEPCENNEDALDLIELDALSSEAEHILNGEPSQVFEELLKLNGSSCGARPKIVAYVSDDKKQIRHGGKKEEGYSDWLIKFSCQKDKADAGLEEYVYSVMAKNAGIEMPETYLFPSKNGFGHFGVKRFDRVGTEKVHVHTACGLLHASHRTSSIDYENLLKLTYVLTKDFREVVKMARLMIFNVLAENKDDHSKNFAFILDRNNCWKLSPAYDLTKSMGINGEQTALVNKKGTNITTEDFLTICRKFDISDTTTLQIIEQVKNALSGYSRLMKEFG